MQVLFDFSTLYQSSTIFLTSQTSPNFSFDSIKLKEWWQKLSISEKLEIAQISSSQIIADINDAINDAILIFQVNRKSQQKNLITSKKSLDDQQDRQIHEFRFNFVGKDVLPDNVAQLISAYHAIIYTSKKTSQDLPIHQQSTLKVREEHLDAFVDLLQAVLIGQRPVFDLENYFKIYAAINEYSGSKISVFKGVKSSSVLKLLNKLISASVLFENNLYKAFLLQAKQPSRESIETKLSAKDSDSDKEQNDVTTSASSTNSGHQTQTDEPKISIEVFSAENIPTHSQYQQNLTWQDQTCFMNSYQGFEVGNLDIDFEFADILMTDYADQEEDLAALMKDIMQDIEAQMKKYNYYTESEETASDLQNTYSYYGLRPSSKKTTKDNGYWRSEKRESSRDSRSSYDDTTYDSYTGRYPKKHYKTRYTRREQVYYMPKAKSNNGE